MVGVLYQDDPDDARGVPGPLRRRGLPASSSTTDGRLAIDYGVTGPPESYFVDADGHRPRASSSARSTDALMDRAPGRDRGWTDEDAGCRVVAVGALLALLPCSWSSG